MLLPDLESLYSLKTLWVSFLTVYVAFVLFRTLFWTPAISNMATSNSGAAAGGPPGAFGTAQPSRSPLPIDPEATKRFFTLKDLAHCNGEGVATDKNPQGFGGDDILICVNGEVYHATSHPSGRGFYGPQSAYHVFAGCDATMALAQVQIDKNLCNVWNWTDLTDSQRKVLADWILKFRTKSLTVWVSVHLVFFGQTAFACFKKTWSNGVGGHVFLGASDVRCHETRSITLNDPSANSFCTNEVITSRYTLLNFIPKNLWEQFQKVCNVYFLFIGILQIIPSISTTNGFPTIGFPLVFVLTVNALKDAYEDWRRHKADAEENRQSAFVVVAASPQAAIRHTTPERAQRAASHQSSVLVPGKRTSSSWEIALARNNIAAVGDDFDIKQSRTSIQQLETTAALPWSKAFDRLVEEGYIVEVPWKKLAVGDTVICRNHEKFPADIILLASSDSQGVALIDTASLDGETNLKMRQAHADSIGLLGHHLEDCCKKAASLSGNLRCCPPDANLGHFEGALRFHSASPETDIMKIPLGTNQLLLRGCRLRNTAWTLGVVIYSGPETKIQMNASRTPHKVSRVERRTNRATYLIFVVQVALCITGAISTVSIVSSKDMRNLTYLGLPPNPSAILYGVNRFFTWMVLLANMVPISLVVTMGMVKAAQGIFIGMDWDMYHSATNTRATVRTSDLNEELGQVEFVFSDKTGTLTQNCMELRKCCIMGHSYGKGLTEVRQNILRRRGVPVTPLPIDQTSGHRKTPHVNLEDPELEQRALAGDPDIVEFFMHLAVNHSVVVEEGYKRRTSYSFSSPDEGSLVYGAQHFHVEFLSRSTNGVLLSVLGKMVEVTVLAALDFDSVRKRSSVLCRYSWNETASPRYLLFCKGADTVIVERLRSKGTSPHDAQMLTTMESYALDGLRTLCIAKRELTEREATEWLTEFTAASLSVENRNEELDRVAALIEKDLELQGVTGIEDLLQDGVPDTLEALREVWMLTGDKVETAVNIGIAASLIPHDAVLLTYQWDSLLEPSSLLSSPKGSPSPTQPNTSNHASPATVLESRMKADLQKLYQSRGVSGAMSRWERWWREIRSFCSILFFGYQPQKKAPATAKNVNAAIVIDGDCLGEVLKGRLTTVFLDLCKACSTVLCCRSTPFQKGAVVNLVKQRLGKVTLAIGDGANDCNMIQSAHVGIGLRGLEGMQAFNVSDYGISQFRFLKVLLLCHGRWCYRRLCRLVLYMFYKNIVLVLPIFYFSMSSLFSGQKIYFEYLYQLYNVLLTSLPVMVFGILDQDVNKSLSLSFPELYRLGHRDYYLNTPTFCRWLINGVVQSSLVLLLPRIAFGGSKVDPQGYPAGLWFMGQATFLLVMIVVNFKILLESSLITWMTWLGVGLSLLAWFVFMYLFSSFPLVAPEVTGLLHVMLVTPMSYIVVLGTSIICVSWDLVWKSIRKTFIPELYHKIQQQAVKMDGIEEHRARIARATLLAAQEQSALPSLLSSRTETIIKDVSDIELTQLRSSVSMIGPHRGYAFSEADAGVCVPLVVPFCG